MDTQLMQLQTESLQKLKKFQAVLRKSSEESLRTNPKGYNFDASAKDLETSTSEGIEYRKAADKLKKYKEDKTV